MTSPKRGCSILPTAYAGSATALVVDSNATSRRFVEMALGAAGLFTVEAAGDAAGAFEILRREAIDLVIADTELPDQNGLAFFRRLADDRCLRTIPFVFLASDRRLQTRLAALQAGVDDYLLKPCDGGELLARAKACLLRQQRLNEAVQSRSYELAGSLQALGFAELVGIIDLGRRSGVLSVMTGCKTGIMHFKDGALVHATFGNLSGERAFQRMFAEPSGYFEFTPGPCGLADDDWTIQETTTGLIMEAARVLDTERGSSDSGRESHSLIARRTSQAPPLEARSRGLVPAPEGDATVAAQIVSGLADPFALGELRAWTSSELQEHTGAETGDAERFLVLILADLQEGVSAMLPLAGAPTEQWVMRSLGERRKWFGVSFSFRQKRTVDIVVADVRASTEVGAAIHCVPTVLLVCPPSGDLLELGTAARVSLEETLLSLRPRAVVGLGNRALASGLAAMQYFEECAPGVLQSSEGRLGGPTTDIRSLLGVGFRVWAGQGSARRTPPVAEPAGQSCHR